jgi:hypothetical protein
MVTFFSLLLNFSLVVVTIDVLTQKGDLLDSIVSQVSDLVNYGRGGPITLPTSNEGDDTETTHVVAPAHNAKPSV